MNQPYPAAKWNPWILVLAGIVCVACILFASVLLGGPGQSCVPHALQRLERDGVVQVYIAITTQSDWTRPCEWVNGTANAPLPV